MREDIYHLTMKELPVSDRPYEKLETYGSEVLSNAELLGIIFRTGTPQETSVGIARRLLHKIDSKEENLHGLWNMSLEELQEVKGIGRVKSLQIRAVLELSKRVANSKFLKDRTISSPTDISRYYMEEMRYYQKEYFKIIMLDTKCRIIHDETISIGSLNSSIVHPREVFIQAIKKASASIILMHNHPSGDPSPSQEDIMITKRLIEGGKLLGIEVLDHIIFGDGIYVSLKEKGIV